MQNEKNLKFQNLALNFYFEEEADVSSELFSLLELSLEVLAGKSMVLLKNGFDQIEVNLNLCSDEEMRQLNLEHRGKDKSTDVLSFPLQENVRRGNYEDFQGHLELGDIFVAKGVCLTQAKDNNLSYEQEFVHLFVHGFLHLCGYDHEESGPEDKLMRQLESSIMDGLADKRKSQTDYSK